MACAVTSTALGLQLKHIFLHRDKEESFMCFQGKLVCFAEKACNLPCLVLVLSACSEHMWPAANADCCLLCSFCGALATMHL